MRLSYKSSKSKSVLNDKKTKVLRTISRPIRITLLVLLAYYLLHRTIYFVDGVRSFVAVYEGSNRLVYMDVEYVATSFSAYTYSVENKLGTIEERAGKWPAILLLYPSRWHEVYSVMGDEEGRLLAVTGITSTTLYCREDVKKKLKKKGEGWKFDVGEVTGVMLESHTEGMVVITDPDQMAYLQRALRTRRNSLVVGQDQERPTWWVSYSYQDLPLYNQVGGIMENEEGIIIRDFNENSDGISDYLFEDDGRLHTMLEAIQKKTVKR